MLNFPPHMSIKTIHKNNNGVSSARNAGLKIANGKYILFIDPDDYLSENCLKYIMPLLNNNFDILIFDYYMEHRNGEIIAKNLPMFKEGILNKIYFLSELMDDKYLHSHLWNKIIKRTLINDELFNENIKYMEDYDFLTRIADKIKNVYYLPKCLYYYCYNYDGLSKNLLFNQRIDSFNLMKNRYQKFRMISPKIRPNLLIEEATTRIILKYKNKTNDNIEIYKNFINSNIKDILCNFYVGFNLKKQSLFIYLGIARYYYKFK